MNAASATEYALGLGAQAKAASALMAKASTASKNHALLRLAALLRENTAALQSDNAKDLERALANESRSDDDLMEMTGVSAIPAVTAPVSAVKPATASKAEAVKPISFAEFTTKVGVALPEKPVAEDTMSLWGHDGPCIRARRRWSERAVAVQALARRCAVCTRR
jgi:hypothetical protein